jgi:hypothetical protein
VRFELEDDRLVAIPKHEAEAASQRVAERYRIPSLASPLVVDHLGVAAAHRGDTANGDTGAAAAAGDSSATSGGSVISGGQVTIGKPA